LLGKEAFEMKKIAILLLFTGMIFGASGCSFMNATVFDDSITQQYVAYPDQSEDVANPEMARIYLCRPTSVCKGISFKVMDDKTHIGDIGRRGFLCWERKPGTVTVKSTAIDVKGDIGYVSFPVFKGKVYYIQQYIWPIANNKLRQRGIEDGLNLINECTPPNH
jgi:hypothetical protein